MNYGCFFDGTSVGNKLKNGYTLTDCIFTVSAQLFQPVSTTSRRLNSHQYNVTVRKDRQLYCVLKAPIHDRSHTEITVRSV